MAWLFFLHVLIIQGSLCAFNDVTNLENDLSIDVFDLTNPTSWKEMLDYYKALERRWKICINCGLPTLGTGMHLERFFSSGSLNPTVIPIEYLFTRLAIVDVTSLTKLNPAAVLTLDVALQWMALKHDPLEPTLLLFKFGYEQSNSLLNKRSCICKIPGISYDLAQWIASNMSHVVGVATDAPTLESEETREMNVRTVSNVLAKSGIYMIENVDLKRKIPERGCMVMAMPLKMPNADYVPTRLTAFCPSQNSDKHVVMTLRSIDYITQMHSRDHELKLEEILN